MTPSLSVDVSRGVELWKPDHVRALVELAEGDLVPGPAGTHTSVKPVRPHLRVKKGILQEQPMENILRHADLLLWRIHEEGLVPNEGLIDQRGAHNGDVTQLGNVLMRLRNLVTLNIRFRKWIDVVVVEFLFI